MSRAITKSSGRYNLQGTYHDKLFMAVVYTIMTFLVCATVYPIIYVFSVSISGYDAVVDCLDNTDSRIALEKCCEALDIPFVHGAIGGFYGQVSCVFPGDGTMELLYAGSGGATRSRMSEAGNPPFTPQLVAAVQCAETLKLLTGKGELLRKKLLLIDLLRNSMQIIDFA